MCDNGFMKIETKPSPYATLTFECKADTVEDAWRQFAEHQKLWEMWEAEHTPEVWCEVRD